MKKLSFSLKAWWLLVLVCALIFGFSQYWNKKQVIEWDVTLYYSYLPATFIYHDLKFENISSDEWSKRQFYMYQDEEGHSYVKMTSGLAILYAPFFAGAHAVASFSENWPADGFSAPYRFALLLSALVFALWGLHLLRLVLKRFFSDGVAGFTTLIIFAGTNMPYYSFVEPMSHVYNFFLVALIYWSCFKFAGAQKGKYAVLIGLATGLLVLIRPTDIIALLFPLIYFIWKKPVPARVLIPNLILALLLGLAALSPQLAYWKYMTGQWLIYSYNEEGFFFSDPEIWKGLFSYRKGWFVYSPVLFLALPGFALLFLKHRKIASGALLTLLVTIWVTFSWWCWWYGGGFGARPMIEFLPLMALPLAALLQWIHRKGLAWRIPVYAVITFLVGWTVFMNKQYKSQIFHFDSMSKQLFWEQFFIDHHVENYQEKLDPADYEAAKRNEDVN